MRRLAASVFLAIMLFNFLGEGCQLFNIAIVQLNLTPTTLITGIFSHNTKPVAKSCCAGKATSENKNCNCPDCGDHCPMGAACTCDEQGHQQHASDGLFFTLPGCHPENGKGTHYLPLSMRVAFVLEPSSNPVESTRVIDGIFPEPDQLISFAEKPPVPPPRTPTA